MPSGDKLYGGKLDEAGYANSMAQEIEAAFAKVRKSDNITAQLPSGKNAKDMRMLFIAIACGVIEYLHKHPQAMHVKVQDSLGAEFDGYVTAIDKLP